MMKILMAASECVPFVKTGGLADVIGALPKVGDRRPKEGIPGAPPSLRNPPPGCRFADRCRKARPECTMSIPKLREIEPGRFAACHLL